MRLRLAKQNLDWCAPTDWKPETVRGWDETSSFEFEKHRKLFRLRVADGDIRINCR